MLEIVDTRLNNILSVTGASLHSKKLMLMSRTVKIRDEEGNRSLSSGKERNEGMKKENEII
jgi:hypothetical protein